MALSRTFQIRERRRIEIRAEAARPMQSNFQLLFVPGDSAVQGVREENDPALTRAVHAANLATRPTPSIRRSDIKVLN